MNKVRVRFAPSPTGPLHIGGLRTALYNYLWAKKNGGDFILRIEDTDQKRYVEGAENYIMEALQWVGLITDEDPISEGEFGPYRQSERTDLYREKIALLLEKGSAYYAFDTEEDLTEMRERRTEEGIHSPKYDWSVRNQMKNSLSLSDVEVKDLINQGYPYVIRLKINPDETIRFQDIVRGEVSFNSSELDDKVLMKSDGLPTYHFANVVDDHAMKISHVIRGEEWLSSTAHHVLLYRAFELENEMPAFAHLPLILKPEGKGKLSKRDGAKFGIPVFPLDWNAPDGSEFFSGFREVGFHPSALINFLAFLGWNPGKEKEIYSIEELLEDFDLDDIVKSGARFDFSKALWYNQHYIIESGADDLVPHLRSVLDEKNVEASDDTIAKVSELYLERINTYSEIWSSCYYCFLPVESYDEKNLRKKLKPTFVEQWDEFLSALNELQIFNATTIEDTIKQFLQDKGLGFGQVLPILRIALCGVLSGPSIYEISELLGKQECTKRLEILKGKYPEFWK